MSQVGPSSWPAVIALAMLNGQRSGILNCSRAVRCASAIRSSSPLRGRAVRSASSFSARVGAARGGRSRPASGTAWRAPRVAGVRGAASHGPRREVRLFGDRAVSAAGRGRDECTADDRDGVAAVGQQEARQQGVGATARVAHAATHPQSCRLSLVAHETGVARPSPQGALAAWAAGVGRQLTADARGEHSSSQLTSRDGQHRRGALRGNAAAATDNHATSGEKTFANTTRGSVAPSARVVDGAISVAEPW